MPDSEIRPTLLLAAYALSAALSVQAQTADPAREEFAKAVSA